MLSCLMDIEPRSRWLRATPGEAARALGFSSSEAGTFYCRENFHTARNRKDSYLLFFTVSGEGVIQQEGKTIQTSAYTLAALDCSKPHSYHTGPAGAWAFHWAHIDGAGVRGFFSLPLFSGVPCCRLQKSLPAMKEAWDTLLAHIRQTSFEDSLEVSMQLHRILHLFIREETERQAAQNKTAKELCLAAAQYMREHFGEDLSLDRILAQVSLSKSYFIRAFRRYFNTSPYSYLLHYRITKAKELLCTTTLTVREISEVTGFKNTSHFIAQFSRFCAQSPLQYRNSFSQDQASQPLA